MQNIGERLEEARKRKGLSVREAAEATKIRGDFLSAFENERFEEITLPEIYKRGFLKVYSKFLNLDSEKILADYTAHQLGNSKLARKDGREFFGRMDMPHTARRGESSRAPVEAPPPHQSSPEDFPAAAEQKISAPDDAATLHPAHGEGVSAINDSRFPSGEDEPTRYGLDKTLYWKIGLAGGGALVLFLLIFALVKALTSGSGQPTGTAGINEPPEDAPPASEQSASGGDVSEVVLVGKGEVFVQVKQLSNGEILYKGTLSQGERVPLGVRGDADIAFTRGSNLQIIKDGETFEPDVSRSELGKVNTGNL